MKKESFSSEVFWLGWALFVGMPLIFNLLQGKGLDYSFLVAGSLVYLLAFGAAIPLLQKR